MGRVTFKTVPALPVALTIMGTTRVVLGYNGTSVPKGTALVLSGVGTDVEFVHRGAETSLGRGSPVPIVAVTRMMEVGSEVTVEVLFVLVL